MKSEIAVKIADSRTLRQRGFTMMEIIIVVALIAFIMAVAIPQLNIVTGADTPSRLNRLASDIRSAYDMSVLLGKPFRLVFNMATGEYHLEEADRRDFFLGDEKLPHDPTTDEEKQMAEQFDIEFAEYEDLAGEPIKDPEDDAEIKPTSPVVEAKGKLKPVKWTPIENLEWQKRSLGSNLIMREFQSEHHGDRQKVADVGEQGRVMLYFFPNGYVERAIIVIGIRKGDLEADETQQPYTLTTNPYQGTSDVISGTVEGDVFADFTRKP